MSRRYPLATFFALAYVISWLVWARLWLPAFGVDGLPALPFHHALGALGPIAAAFLVSAAETGEAGPADLLRRMGLWRGRLVWVAVALLGPLAVLALAVIGASLLSEEGLSLTGLGRSRELPQLSALGFFAYNVVSFGYGEEVGSSTLPSTSPSPRPFPRRWWSTPLGDSSQCADSSCSA